MKELAERAKKQLIFTIARADMQPVMLVLAVFALSRAWSVFVMWHLGGWGELDPTQAYGVFRAQTNPIFFLLLSWGPPWFWMTMYLVIGVATLAGLVRLGPRRLAAMAAMAGLMIWAFHAIVFFMVTVDKARVVLFTLFTLVSAWVYLRESWTPKAS
jgi:hypothetical protein